MALHRLSSVLHVSKRRIDREKQENKGNMAKAKRRGVSFKLKHPHHTQRRTIFKYNATPFAYCTAYKIQ